MPLHVFQRTIVDAAGNIVPSASVEVRDQATNNLVQVYEDVDGATALGNPFTADTEGFVRFYADNGRYKITASFDSEERIWENERLGTTGDEIKYKQTAAEITAAVTPTNYQYEAGNVRRYGTNTTPGTTDMTAAFQAAFNAANGGPVVVPAGTYLLNGATITLPTEAELVGEGSVVIRISSWSSKSDTTDQSITAKTLFSQTGSQDHTNIVGKLHIRGIRFVNADTSSASRVIYSTRVLESAVIENNSFEDFTVVAAIGAGVVTTGIHANSDAQTTVLQCRFSNNYISSDTRTTAQCPRSLHIYHCMDTVFDRNAVIDNMSAASHSNLFRAVGGHFDTIPVPTRGLANVRVSNNYFKTNTTAAEYNQITKATNITVIGNVGEATVGANPANLMDMFNCFSATFAGNTAYGGGLCFFGHADLNNGSFPNALKGSRGFTASGNTIINPTHTSIFNIGGDGTVSGNRASHGINIVGNTVLYTDGATPTANQAFIYTFLSNDIGVLSNNVSKCPVFIQTFFDQGYWVEGNVLRDIPMVVADDGSDGATQNSHGIGRNEFRGTTGSTTPLSLLNPVYRFTFIDANYTCVLADADRVVGTTTSGITITIPANASVKYPLGTYLTFTNLSAGDVSIAIDTDVLILAGVGSTGTRTLATNGIARATKIASGHWLTDGTGLT